MGLHVRLIISDTKHKWQPAQCSTIMLSVTFYSRYAERHYAECRYAESRGASRGSPSLRMIVVSLENSIPVF